MAEYTPSTSDIRYWLTGPDYEGGPVAEVVGRDFDRWIAAHDREVEKRLIENLEVMGDYLVVRNAREADCPAGPQYGPCPGSDAEPIAPLDQIAGMKSYLAAHDRTVKAEGWDEGWDAREDSPGCVDECGICAICLPDNPCRADQIEGDSE